MAALLFKGHTMCERTLQLIHLMNKHSLTCGEVAELLGRTEQTVFIWRCKSSKTIPAQMLELLEYKLTEAVR